MANQMIPVSSPSEGPRGSTKIATSSSQKVTRLQCGSRALDLSHPHVMGILNVTPDSFSDGGCFQNQDYALRHAEAMVNAGATLIDVGGESTRPGAPAVSLYEELERVLPVVERITAELDVVVSVDTSSPEVMRESARCGVGLLNDVRAFRRPGALAAAAASGLPLCLMHMYGEPDTMQNSPVYDDVVAEVATFLQHRVQACQIAGIARERLLIDPGFGFAKNLSHNLQLFNQLEQICHLGLPMLIGVSRKSMIGQVLDKPVDQRLYGSLALAVLGMQKGARILRVHDVAETMDVVRIFRAIEQLG